MTGPNGNSIFLPAAGQIRDDLSYSSFGYYWSSSLDMNDSAGANNLSFASRVVGWSSVPRCSGTSVRAVCVRDVNLYSLRSLGKNIH